jgi:hypothetical protein
LASVGFVRDDDNVITLGQNWMRLARFRSELLDESEDVAVILAQQLPQM